MTLTELARAMGYKGISKKLSSTVEAMCKTGALVRLPAKTGAGTILTPGSPGA